ncbi:hypothetical protein GM182_01005 [bacterium 3DAC]|jgi:hypothetical protein|nr:hypothetical protein [Dictyoglomota bacterium]UZN22523.1 hypothetical protein GM182_01005 [bacterium 3DAC]
MKWTTRGLRLFLDVVNRMQEDDVIHVLPVLMQSLECSGFVKKLQSAVPEEALFLLSRIEGLFPEHRAYVLTDARGGEYLAIRRYGGYDFYEIDLEEEG